MLRSVQRGAVESPGCESSWHSSVAAAIAATVAITHVARCNSPLHTSSSGVCTSELARVTRGVLCWCEAEEQKKRRQRDRRQTKVVKQTEPDDSGSRMRQLRCANDGSR